MSASRRWIITAAVTLGMFLLAAALLRQDALPAFDGVRMHLLHILDAPLFNLGKQPLTALSLVKIGLFLALLGVVAHSSMSFLQKRLLVHTRLAAGQTYAIARVFSYLIFYNHPFDLGVHFSYKIRAVRREPNDPDPMLYA